jgi:hypothetical protein
MGVLVGSTSSRAQEAGDCWSFVIAPYAWAPAMEGTMSIQGQEVDIEVTRDDFIDSFDGGFMGTVVARRGDWGLFGDFVWTNLGMSTPMPPVDIDPTLAILSLQGVRRLTPYADVTAGVRWNHLSLNAELGPPIGLTLDKSRDWVDPIVGVVLRSPSYGRFHGAVVADVGGFGVASDFIWQVFPTIGFDITEWASLETGWRFLSVNYETEDDGGFAYDVVVDGPALGIAFRI